MLALYTRSSCPRLGKAADRSHLAAASVTCLQRSGVTRSGWLTRNPECMVRRFAALRAWMLLFVDYIATKQIIAPALNRLLGGPSKVYEASGAQITGAVRALVERAIESGDIRRDLDPLDLLRALIGVSNVACGPDWQQSARRLVDILITGSRSVKGRDRGY